MVPQVRARLLGANLGKRRRASIRSGYTQRPAGARRRHRGRPA